jgi:serine/threonine protein kinase
MPSPSLANAVIGPFVVRELISAGGIAEVYRAQHRDDAKSYAVKVMRPERQAERHHLKAFQQEFALLQRLDHPGIPKARRLDEVNGRPCMVLDHVPGQTLYALRAARAPLDARAVFAALVAIVAHLHEEDLVHNDLKLENVILRPEGGVSLIDFGNAREVRRAGLIQRLLGRREPVFGTPTYLAPELVADEAGPSPRSDCYSLGVCCFILLTGEPPFIYDRTSARLHAAVNQAPPSIRSRVPSLPMAFARLIDSCLAKDPAKRPEDAGVLGDALRVLAKAETSRTALPAKNHDVGPPDVIDL